MLIKYDEDELELPDTGFGSRNMRFNGMDVPSTKLWDFAAEYLGKSQKVPKNKLFELAKRASVFAWKPTDMLLHTHNPDKEDEHIAENVYKRSEKQRIRPLSAKFKVIIAKFDGTYSVEAAKEMHEVAEQIGYFPVGMNDERIYYAKNPSEVFNAFGTQDWVRIAVYLKRPGGAKVPLSLR